jgi:hypothetical protein
MAAFSDDSLYTPFLVTHAKQDAPTGCVTLSVQVPIPTEGPIIPTATLVEHDLLSQRVTGA